MAVLQLWELLVTKIGKHGLHLLISLHSPWLKIRRKWALSRGWPRDISRPCGFGLERFSCRKKLLQERLNSVLSFELIFIFYL